MLPPSPPSCCLSLVKQTIHRHWARLEKGFVQFNQQQFGSGVCVEAAAKKHQQQQTQRWAQHPQPKAHRTAGLCPFPGDPSSPHRCLKGCSKMQALSRTAGRGWGQEGPEQLLHFQSSKSQKWQKVKAHQHVKTLVIIKTFVFFFFSFCQIFSWEREQWLINRGRTRQQDPNSLRLHN